MDTIARITNTKKLLLAGEIIERDGPLSFGSDRAVKVREFVEGAKFSLDGNMVMTAQDLIENVRLNNIVWDRAKGVSIDENNNLINIATRDGWGVSGACSTQKLYGDGNFETVVPDSLSYVIVGLSSNYTGAEYSLMNFAVQYIDSGRLYFYELGVSATSTVNVKPGDIIRVAVESNVVKCYVNGALVHTFNAQPTYPLMADVTMFFRGATVRDVTLEGFE